MHQQTLAGFDDVNKNLTVGHTRSLDTDALNAEEDA